MREDILLYFGPDPAVLPLYEALAARLDELFPTSAVTVQKTQITFRDPHSYCVVSLPTRRRKGWPEHCLIVTFGLGTRLESPRVFQSVQPYPGRYTHHVPVAQAAQIDRELISWIILSHGFSGRRARS